MNSAIYIYWHGILASCHACSVMVENVIYQLIITNLVKRTHKLCNACKT